MKTTNPHTYKDLIVWQKAIDLCDLVYDCTTLFPSNETFNLASQMKRSAVSIPSNIAEGYSRRFPKEYVRFLRIAHGSLIELETQIIIAKKRKYLKSEKLDGLSLEVAKMLNKLIKVLLTSAY